jgi:hypothetical protein
MNWLDEADVIDSEQWVVSGIEVMGTTPGMCWVANVQTKQMGLFKPETRWRESAYCEYAASKIASALDIPSARVLVGELFGFVGCISLDVRASVSEQALAAESLYRCGGLLELRQVIDGEATAGEATGGEATAGEATDSEPTDSEPTYSEPEEMSFEGLLPYLPPEAELGLVQMMFFDCISENTGRHESNYMFSIDDRRAISGMLPLYDNGICFQSVSSSMGSLIGSDGGEGRGRGGRGRRPWFMRDGSSFPYYGEGGFHTSFPFNELYALIRRDYPETIGELVARTNSEEFRAVASKLGCYEFIIERINRFEQFAQSSN